MKRYIALLLIILSVLAMAGCASEEEKAMEAAAQLLEAGEYEAAIEAYASIGAHKDISAQISAAADAMIAAGEYDKAIEALSAVEGYQLIAEKMDEAQKLRHEANTGFLFGVWKSMTSRATLTLRNDGTGELSLADEHYSVNYTYEDNKVTLDNPVTFSLTVSETDGVVHLVNESYSLDLVTENDYAQIGPKEIAITMDNWEQYFELRLERVLLFDSFKEPFAAAFEYGVFLRDEYMDKLPQGSNLIDLTFKLEYDYGLRTVENILSDDYQVTDSGHFFDHTRITSKVQDYRNNSNILEEDVKFGRVCGLFSVGYSHIDGNDRNEYSYMDNGQIVAVQGTILLLP